jgi:transcriptional regulator with XRE-family HTH domain
MTKKKFKSKLIAGYGKKLLHLRKYFAFTQEKMSAIMNITLSSYKKNELGKHLMSTSSLIALHNRLGISLEWFLFDRGEMSWKPTETVSPEKQVSDPFTMESDEMISLMKEIPLIHHGIMLHFQELKLKHKELIQEYLQGSGTGEETAAPATAPAEPTEPTEPSAAQPSGPAG